MVKNRRLQILKSAIKQQKILTVEAAIELTHASESTIRRDFEMLEQEGWVKRFHGGAEYTLKPKDEIEFMTRYVVRQPDKELIAKYAASLVDDGDTIFLDGGTTVIHMIPYLQGKDIHVVTNGLSHVPLLLEYNIPTTILGGEIKEVTSVVVGEETSRQLSFYFFDKAFLGTNAISETHGFSTPDVREAAVKSMVVRHSKAPYFLADASKFGTSAFSKICELNEAVCITNELQPLYQAMMRLMVAQ